MRGVVRHKPIQGELQSQIMAALWRIERGTVESVRGALPHRYQGAYTTVQTVLNRLAEHGMLVREKEGKTFVYAPRFSEGEYISRSIQSTLAGASSQARQVAIAQLVAGLEGEELSDLQRLARAAEGAPRVRRKG